MEIEEKKRIAIEYREEGYNCAQCVLLAQSDRLGLKNIDLAALSAGLGGGMAVGEICGVISALAIGKGLIEADGGSSGKQKVMPKVKATIARFSEPFGGKVTCRDLKGKCGATCPELICRGVEFLEE